MLHSPATKPNQANKSRWYGGGGEGPKMLVSSLVRMITKSEMSSPKPDLNFGVEPRNKTATWLVAATRHERLEKKM